MRKFLLFISLLSFVHLEIFSQSVSNEGTEFWACFPSHVPNTSSPAFLTVFITSKNNSSGVISCGTFSEQFAITANTVTSVNVPRNESYISGNGVSINKGIKVIVNPGQPKVVVYAHVFAGKRSAATLVIPKQTLG